jgi:hypothetical protein
VKDAYRGFLPKTRLGTVTKAVRQSAGLVMPKHPAPGFGSIAPQLRPDEAIVMDLRPTWHYHGREGGDCPMFPAEATGAGKYLPKALVLVGLSRDQHVHRDKSAEPYDAATGIGDHHGVNIEVVHYHAPASAKYILLGENKRIDVHPWSVRLLPRARRVFFVMEGTLKNDAVLSTGEAVFSVPSVTLWDPRELRLFVKRYLQDKTVFIVPDADWFTNVAVDRQALLVRSCIRRQGVDAYVAAPPIAGLADGIKGVDDFLGKGGTIEGLIVRGREAPKDRILDLTIGAAKHRFDRRKRNWFALEGLALHAGQDGSVAVPMGTLARFMDTRKDRIVPILDDLSDALEVDGSLETKIEMWGETRFMDWVERPTLIIKDEFRAVDNDNKALGDFWKEDVVTRAEFDSLSERVVRVEQWQDDRDRSEAEAAAEDVISGFEELLAEVA